MSTIRVSPSGVSCPISAIGPVLAVKSFPGLAWLVTRGDPVAKTSWAGGRREVRRTVADWRHPEVAGP